MRLKFQFFFLAALSVPLWAQTDASQASSGNGAMIRPAPVGGAAYSLGFASEERSNYLRGGLTFQSAYDDDVYSNGTVPVGSASYSIYPTVGLDVARPRTSFSLLYSPGFTFYQRASSYNESDERLGVDFKYRLSPHVSMTVQDNFSQTSNLLSQQSVDSTTVISGSSQLVSQPIVAPIAEVFRNVGSVGISDQLGPNEMIGANGSFTNLHYPQQSEVPGLYDSSSKGGSGYYNYRLSRQHYIGVTYQYQDLLAYPTGLQSQTQTHTVELFYTFYASSRLSFSFFGGPQYADTEQGQFAAVKGWSPAAGASFGWQAGHTSLAGSYSRAITDGGGLVGATHTNAGTASIRQQVTRRLDAGVTGSYTENSLVSPIASYTQGGHAVQGSASVHQEIGGHVGIQLGYTRVHQSYSGIAAISGVPDRNREWVSISYSFVRPLGR